MGQRSDLRMNDGKGQQQDKLIPTEPAGDDRFRNALRQPLTQLNEYFVTAAVTQRVIDVLEVIQVNKDDTERPLRFEFAEGTLQCMTIVE